MNHFRNITRITVLIILVLAAVLLSALQSEETRESAIPVERVPVRTVSISESRKGVTIKGTGVLKPASTGKLAFKTGGYLQSMIPKKVTTVKKGRVLATLNRSEIVAHVSKAKEAVAKANRDVKRTDQLFADSVISREVWENSHTALKLAKADLKIANYNLYHSTIKAPSNGKVLQQFSEKGEMVAAGQPIFLFGGIKKGWKVITSVSEREVAALSLSDSASIHFEAYPNRTFAGTIAAIADAPNAYTGTYEVELHLAESETTFRMGYTADVALQPQTLKNLLWIPTSALVQGKGREGEVFGITAESLIVSRKVVIAQIDDRGIAISSGLEGIESVVSDGSAYLTKNSIITRVK